MKTTCVRLWLLVGCLLSLSLSLLHAQQAKPKPAAANGDGLLLKVDDTIRVEIFNEDELDTEARIMKNGEVVLPLIEPVKLGGLSVGEAMKSVRTAYIDQEILADPKVRIVVVEAAKQFFSVIGAVNNAGEFPMPPAGKTDLAAALATAGGLAPTANRNRIVVSRADGSASTYTAAQADGGKVPIIPSDRVVVFQSDFVGKSVMVLGQVRKPGPVPMPLNGQLDIVTAIAHAGGFTELAKDKSVKVARGGNVTILNVREMTEQGNKSYTLRPDDIITVDERWF